jgi:alkylation response protein AidB-like acyl-CoA dehydrogenase
MANEIIHAAKLPNDWLSKEELDALTPEILVDRIKAIVPEIEAKAHEVERNRKPDDDVWNKLRKTGMFYHFVPKPYNGLEFGVEDMINEILPIAEVCASTAWTSSFVLIHMYQFGMYNKRAQDEVFGKTPYMSCPTVFSPPGKLVPVPGGYKLSGHWKWGSGVMHSDWLMCVGVIEGSNPPAACYATLPIEQGNILDNWFMDGMAGTGSQDIVVEDVFIPEHMILDTKIMRDGGTEGAALHAHNPIYNAPTLPILTMTAAISPVGAARGAVKYFKKHMQERSQFGSGAKTSERPQTQARLGQADIHAIAAEALLRDVARWIEERSLDPTPVPTSERMSYRAQVAQAVQEARKAVVTVAEAAGAGMHDLNNPLQRILRDVNTMSTHITFDHDMSIEQHGRGMVGLPPTSLLL